MGSAIGNIGDMATKATGELTPMQQGGRALMAGVGGGLNSLNKRQQQPNMPGPMPMLPPAPQFDFSQIGNKDVGFMNRRSPFYGG